MIEGCAWHIVVIDAVRCAKLAMDRGMSDPPDPELLPDAVMALLDPDLVRHQRDVLGVEPERGADALVAMVFGAAGIGGLGPNGGISRN